MHSKPQRAKARERKEEESTAKEQNSTRRAEKERYNPTAKHMRSNASFC